MALTSPSVPCFTGLVRAGILGTLAAMVPFVTPPAGSAQSVPATTAFEEFALGTWRVTGRRADGQGGWQNYEAWLHVERTTVGGWPGVLERWHSRPGSWSRTPDLGSSVRMWDPEEDEWVSRMFELPTMEGWSWPPFIWPEISTWVADAEGFAMPARAHNDFISNHTDTAGIVLDPEGGWSIWAARRPAGGSSFGLWEEVQATPADLERGVWPAVAAGLPARRVETVIERHVGSRGLAMDPEGNVYMGGVVPGVFGSDDDIPVLKITPEGEVSVFATGLVRTAGLAWSDGALYAKAHDVEGGRLVRIGVDGTVRGIADVSGDALAADDRGHAYIIDSTEPRVVDVAPDGTATVLSTHPDLTGALGTVLHPGTGTLFVADWATGEIHAVETRGESRGATRLHAVVPGPGGNAVAWLAASDEWIWATGFGSEQVFRIAVDDGRVEWVAGSGLPGHRDGPAGEARFRSPNGIAVSPDGQTVWVAELGWMDGGVYPEGRLRRIFREGGR